MPIHFCDFDLEIPPWQVYHCHSGSISDIMASTTEAADIRDSNDQSGSHVDSQELHERLIKSATDNDADSMLLLLKMHGDEIDIN